MADVPTIRRGKHAAPGFDSADYGAYDDPSAYDQTGYANVQMAPDAEMYRMDRSESYHRHRRHRSRRRRRRIIIAVVAILLALVAVAGVFGFRMYQSAKLVRADAKEMLEEVKNIRTALKNGDAEMMSTAAETSVRITDRMEAEVSTPMWDIAQAIPIIGDDVRIGRTLATMASDLSNNALVPVSKGLAGFKLSDLIADNRINADLFRQLATTLSDAAPALQRALSAVDELPEPHLKQVRDIVGKVSEPLEDMRGFIEEADAILQLLPEMIGANGVPRRYLVVAQNNSELRSTGGLPGSWGVVTIDNGAMSMGDFTSILHREGLLLEDIDEEYNAFKTNFHTNPAQMNFVPDFTRVGRFARDYWLQAEGEQVDGVFALDPVVLQRLLALTNGFADWDGDPIDGTNAAEIILSKTYWWYRTNELQDTYFSSIAGGAASVVFDHLGDMDVEKLLEVAQQAIKERRLLAWMANADEEGLIDRLGASGALETDPRKPVLGVYINDVTYSKYSWYLAADTQVGEGMRNADGTLTYNVVTTITNTISEQDAWDAPRVITGGSEYKRDKTDMLDRIYLMAPAGGSIEIIDTTCTPWGKSGDFTYHGLQMVEYWTALLPGESAVFTYNVTVPNEGAEAPLAVRMTPLAQEPLMTQNAPQG